MAKNISDIDSRFLSIGQKIKRLRIGMGYSSAEIFAYEYGLNRVSYWRMKKGNNITLNSLLKIVDIHKITLKEFFVDID